MAPVLISIEILIFCAEFQALFTSEASDERLYHFSGLGQFDGRRCGEETNFVLVLRFITVVASPF